MKQPDIARRYGLKHRLPVYYLTDLVGMALGIPASALGVNRHFVEAPCPV
jgi:heterodisulfide reductase subunit B